jgi:asparagine synthase (glutamine-hydrolysing)
MTRGFCGWLDRIPGPAGARDAIADVGRDASLAVSRDGHGWAYRTAMTAAACEYHGDDEFVIIDGAPVAAGPALAGLAAEHGLAQACLLRYRQVGPAFLNELEGAFALAISSDGAARSLLAIDRVGISRMYHAAGAGGMAFATRLEYLAGCPAIDNAVDPQSIYDYLYHHVIPSPYTIFRDVRSLVPGSCVEIVAGEARTDRYWRVEYTRERARPDRRSLEREFRQLLRACVGQEAETPKKVGCFLSGGTDSSTLAGVLGDLTGAPVSTYSIGFDQEGFDEMEYARIAARHFGTDHHEYYVTPQDIIELVPQIPRAYGQPFGNSSVVPTFYCARMARDDGIGKLLGGDGGDELFGGNKRYGTQVLFSYYSRIPRALREYALEPIVNAVPFGDRIMPVRKLRRYIEQARVPMPDRMHTWGYLDFIGREAMFDAEFLSCIDPDRPLSDLRREYKAIMGQHIVNKMAAIDLKLTLADNDLLKVTNMCELAGVEVGYPFLQQAMVDFASRLPADQKVRNQTIRYFFKRALRDYLPTEIIHKQKHGFGLPFGDWLMAHDGLRGMAFDLLATLRSRRILRADFLDDLVNRKVPEHPNYFGGLVWVLMILELSLEQGSPGA